MKRHRTRSVLFLTALAGGTLGVSAHLAPVVRASAEDVVEEKSAPAPAPDGSAVNVVQEGVLHNRAHGFRFPVPSGFELRASSTADEVVLVVPKCDECVLRILVSPGNTDSLDTTARALKKQVASEPAAQVIDEQRIRVAREPAYTLVKEEAADTAAPAKGTDPEASKGPRIFTRYVTFNHGEDKYYFVLREPAGRFGEDEDAFERLLAKLRFDS